MRTVLAISDSVENTEFDLGRSIATIKAHSFDPLAVVPTFYRTDGNSESFDVNEIIDYVFDECDTAGVRIGYLTRPEVLSYLCSKLANANRTDVVIEPSLISERGDILVSEDIYSLVCDELIKASKLLVVNSFEAELLAEFECPMPKDYLRAAKKIFNEYGCNVLIKACPRTGEQFIVFDGNSIKSFEQKSVVAGFDRSKYDFVTAISCALANGKSVHDASAYAADYVFGYISNASTESFVVEEFPEEPAKISFPNTDNNLNVETVVEAEPEVVPEPIPEPVVEGIKVSEPVARPVVRKEIDFTKKTEVPSFKMPEFKLTTDKTSLVSPAKSLRELSRGFDYPTLKDPASEPQNTAVTTTIEKPAPGPLGAVSDISTPEARLKYNIQELESLKNRLKNIAGSEQ